METVRTRDCRPFKVRVRTRQELAAMYVRRGGLGAIPCGVSNEMLTKICGKTLDFHPRKELFIKNTMLELQQMMRETFDITVGHIEDEFGSTWEVSIMMLDHTIVEIAGKYQRARTEVLPGVSFVDESQPEYNMKNDLERTMRELHDTYELEHMNIYHMLDRVRARKQDIVNHLGLDRHTMRRVVKAKLNPEQAASFMPKPITRFISRLGENYGFDFVLNPTPHIVQNKQQQKPIRFLQKLCKKHDIGIGGDLLTAVNARDKHGNLNEDAFWPKLGEVFNSPSLTMYLSANPCDLLTVSHNGGFSSCLRPNGEYFSSVAHFLQDDFTAVCYVGDPKKKVGRALVYLNDRDKLSFLFSRSYGQFPDNLRDIGRQAIESALSTYYGVPNEWYVDPTGLKSRSLGGVYFDGNTSELVRHASALHVRASDPAFSPSFCVICGKKTVMGSRSIVCVDHQGIKMVSCCSCGHRMVEEDTRWHDDNGPYCDGCYEDRFCSCEDCYETMHEDDAYTVNGGERIVCESCLDNYLRCSECDELNHENEAHYSTASGNLICEGCYDSYYYTCDGCNDAVHMNYAHTLEDNDDNHYCENCLDNYPICEECDGRYSEVTESNMCEECHEEQHHDCAECGEEHHRDELTTDGYCPDCDCAREEAS